jgi:hypothetical protein
LNLKDEVKATGRIMNMAEPIHTAYAPIMTSNVKFEDLTVVTIKVTGFWVVMP